MRPSTTGRGDRLASSFFYFLFSFFVALFPEVSKSRRCGFYVVHGRFLFYQPLAYLLFSVLVKLYFSDIWILCGLSHVSEEGEVFFFPFCVGCILFWIFLRGNCFLGCLLLISIRCVVFGCMKV